MKHRYHWLWPVLLWLGACSTDTKSDREPAAAAPAAPVDSLRRPQPAAPSIMGSTARSEPGKAFIPDQPDEPADTTAPEMGPRLAAIGRLTYRTARRRGPTTLANAPADTAADSGPAALAAFCAAALPSAQVFSVRPGRDTVLVGREGTRLLLPADVFELPPGGGPVEVTLREFYSTPDMILAGLHTRAGNQLLETGGMLQVTAMAAGRPVALRPGSTYELQLPTDAPRPGMQLFEGATGHDGHLDWHLPTSPELDSIAADANDWSVQDTTAIRIPTATRQRNRRGKRGKASELAHWQWPGYPRGEKHFQKDLAQLVDYPAATRLRLKRGRRIGRAERETLRAATEERREKILRVVRLDFWVDSTGAVAGPEPLPNQDAELNRAVAAALLRLPRWQPGQQPDYRNARVARQFTARARVRVDFGESGKVYVSAPDWDARKAMDQHAKRRSVLFLAYRDSLWKATEPQRRAWALAQQARERGQQAAIRLIDPRRARKDTSSTPVDTLNNIGYAEGQLYYTLQAQQFGWINCDRFNEPMTNFTLRTEDQNVTAVLVFQKIRSIINGYSYGDGRVSLLGPLGGQAVLVVMKREQGVTYLALHPFTIIGNMRPKLEFRPVTAAELRTALAQLQPQRGRRRSVGPL